MKFEFLLVLLLSAVATYLTLSQDVSGAEFELPQSNEPYPLTSNEMSLEQALKVFSRNLRIGLILDGKIELTSIVSTEKKLSVREYLDELATLHDFHWYFDGATLTTSALGNLETQVFALRKITGEDLLDLLKSLGVYQDKFIHKADSTRQTVLVIGPKAYTDIVAKVVESAETSAQRKVRVVRGSGVSTSAPIVSETASSVADLDSPNFVTE